MEGKEDLYINEAGDDDWTCLCGNTSHTDGFHPCDADGNDVEPDNYWSEIYRCDRCGRIIKVTGKIVGQTKDELMSESQWKYRKAGNK